MHEPDSTPAGHGTVPIPPAPPVADRVRLPLTVSAETKKAVEVLAKTQKKEFGEVLQDRTLAQCVAEYREFKALLAE